MARIDEETVRRILDAADIVEVVSDFVALRRRGANYIGLCPFHNERTPSFSVSPKLQMCKCFSCGESASAVGFIMKHEQMTFPEALKYLAKKYNIEVKEKEETEADRRAASEREAMLALNDWAMRHFEHNLLDTDEGQAVGLSYFRQRGMSDAAIKRFHLGYSPENWTDLTDAALKEGFDLKYLIATGLTIHSEEKDRNYDRYRARVIYPIHSLSGKVVGFGGRILHNDKKAAKYVNSPESAIYTKNREVYGLYQAKSSISRKDQCILVEGYMDVISMSQRGIENVVSSSGTSLTEGQIALIRRFTKRVIVIYDSDAAGIKASLRGIDMLLAAGLDIKVVLLPDGDDPDSFAQAHTTEEIEQYLAEHAQDFINFKIDILLADAGSDPMARARVINDIIKSVAAIPDGIVRQIYIKEIAERFGIEDKAVSLQVTVEVEKRKEEEFKRSRQPQTTPQQRQPAEPAEPVFPPEIDTPPISDGPVEVAATATATTPQPEPEPEPEVKLLPQPIVQAERDVMYYVLRYGMLPLFTLYDENGNTTGSMLVIDYVRQMLLEDSLWLQDAACAHTFDQVWQLRQNTWPASQAQAEVEAQERHKRAILEGQEKTRQMLENNEVNDLKAREQEVLDAANAIYNAWIDEHAMAFIPKFLASSPHDDVRHLTEMLVADKHMLSKVHTKYAPLVTERDRLTEFVPKAVYVLKVMILDQRIKEIKEILQHASGEEVVSLMQQLTQWTELKAQFGLELGERIIAPRR